MQTVLAIDDVPANLKLLGEILGPAYRFLCSTSAQAGFEIAVAQRPDVILLDVVMPEVDGYEICRQLKAQQQTEQIPVIFITSLKDETDETRGLDIGAIDYITKPFCPAIVRARIRNHLELKRYRDLLEAMSMTDGLTGVANRRHFEQFLDREWRSAIRRQAPMSLVLMDIDHFKLYNDHYGHLEGDECLRAVAQALQGGARRASELVARYGGEEFACVLPETSLESAKGLAGQQREAVLALERPHARSTWGFVTVSMGVASVVPSLGQEPGDLIRQADEHLYVAKKNGRNQVNG
ncbi:MAG TPA: diguanylate cyclase [Candidatus Xenobia bacterium]